MKKKLVSKVGDFSLILTVLSVITAGILIFPLNTPETGLVVFSLGWVFYLITGIAWIYSGDPSK